MLKAMDLSETPRTTITRMPERGRFDRADLYAVLDAGLICHLGLVRDGAPVVIPTGYGRAGERIYLHASSGSAWAREADGAPVCVTVTLLDAIVYARSVFDHSMNYRSAVVVGRPRLVTGEAERSHALDLLVDHVTPGRSATLRRPTRKELAATTVLALPLHEASVKRRAGDPSDEDVDVEAGGVWAGVVPLGVLAGEPVTGADVDVAEVPQHVAARVAALNRRAR